ncbi:MAG: hypothetical protein CMQ40_10955 [Gammaproteobacteria bacterium]|nr:hypothetical protein [Gammaproteobacteria bacterium]
MLASQKIIVSTALILYFQIFPKKVLWNTSGTQIANEKINQVSLHSPRKKSFSETTPFYK